jgi:mannan endo-1,4-beta-mannosidase
LLKKKIAQNFHIMPPFIPVPIDSMATNETKNLYANLFRLRNSKTVFGHQDSLAYGNGWVFEQGINPNGRVSDVFDTLTSKQFPGLFGWDIAGIEDNAATHFINFIKKETLKQHIKKAYDMGCINTICWHANNPVFGGTAWNNNATTLANLLDSNQPHFNKYLDWLTNVATFLKSLIGSDGKQIPIIFRPFHECSFGNCFWWNDPKNNKEDYKKLWRKTITFLKDTCNVHNVIYAFNMSNQFTEPLFLTHYPDNGFVDIISFDDYQETSDTNQQFIDRIKKRGDLVVKLATERGKIPAIAEIGCHNLCKDDPTKPYINWFTQTLAPSIKDKLIAYVMLWRNPKGAALGDGTAFFSSYPEHATKSDFNNFFKIPEIIFSKTTKSKNVYN